MTNFNYYCNLYGSDKGDSMPDSNHYAGWYENWFFPIIEKVTNICEIGVFNGSSTKAFKSYFPNAEILGLDIHDKTKYNEERITTKILDQSNFSHLQNFVDECKSNNLQFDIILDDGSHDIGHQQMTFGKFFQLLKPGGIYIIEDMCTSYFSVDTNLYGYTTTQVKKNNNTIQFLNQRPFASLWIDELNLNYINNEVDYISIFDRANPTCTYKYGFKTDNEYQIRSITSIIKKNK
jgi:hypothetical protein